MPHRPNSTGRLGGAVEECCVARLAFWRQIRRCFGGRPFPQSRQGRPSHRDFRGRLGVHSRYSLPTCRQPLAASFLPGSGRFVASTTAGIVTRAGRPLPRQDFHLLDQRAYTHGARGPVQLYSPCFWRRWWAQR